ncbi:MAG: Beta-lactamase domain-containing protein [Thermoanaerobacterales bacterium 50_218]|nr:MAG: Beta-lactamase domain-containing protein [Thermoanaerobacterales bacterium 50_218]HAA89456.1 exonuclease [Peptococcaceae bacterium]
MVYLTFYDGNQCIGGNKILLEDGDVALFLDFGTSFKTEGMFFDGFLGPRQVLGLNDLFALGLLPPLRGLYRTDLECPGLWTNFSESPYYRELEVQAVLLSHAHLDHCGYLSYVSPEIPIYTSLTTALICKALQDTGSGNRLQEICYVAPRELKEGLLRTIHYRRAPYQQRSYFVFGSCNGAHINQAFAFWKRCYGSRDLDYKPLQICDQEEDISGVKVRFWPVDHSIPGAVAFGVKTSAGWVVYTGDFRAHGRRAHLTRSFIKELAALNPRVLICEGTHPGTERPITEGEVFANSLEVVENADGLVVADFGPRNVERLLSFLEIAQKTGRQLVLTAKDVYLLDALRSAGEMGVPDPFSEEQIALYVKPKGVTAPWETALLERFSAVCRERMVDAAKVRADQGSFIMCFSYYDFPALLDVSPDGGTYIYSSSEAFDEEMLLDHERIRNWINYFGFELYGTLGRDREKCGFHASGHIHGPGIEELVETVRPEILIPVHTEDHQFFYRFQAICRVIFPDKGRRISID